MSFNLWIRLRQVMHFKCLFVLASILVLFGPQSCISNFISSLFRPLNLKCDQQWPQSNSQQNGLSILETANLCLDTHDQICVGIKCNETNLDCQMIQIQPPKTIRCIANPENTLENVHLRLGLAQRQLELALIELGHGQLMPASVDGISPISIPILNTAELQIQFGRDILVCYDSRECKLWVQRTNHSSSFPSLTFVHIEGTMNLVGHTPIVIGGMDQEGAIHGMVELYYPANNQWKQGPSLFPPRRVHSTVVLNKTSVVVVGGFNHTMLKSVKILNLNDMSWEDLADLPVATNGMVCGIIKIETILCIGGGDRTYGKTANVLDLTVTNPLWERNSTFDTDSPIAMGFILQLQNTLYCMSLYEDFKKASRALRRMKMTEEDHEWELLTEFPNSLFQFVSPYVLDGYIIHIEG